jgi:hypothetical protein
MVDSCPNIYFHPWEFTDLSNFQLPWCIKRLSGSAMPEQFEKYLVWRRRFARFGKMAEFDLLYRQRRH